MPNDLHIPATQEIPLSLGQQRIWVVNQHDPTRAAYNELTGIRLTGSFRVAALEQSLRAIVARHEVLRTCYPTDGGLPRPRVDGAGLQVLSFVDLSSLQAQDREAAAARCGVEEGCRPFDLEMEIPVRAKLLSLGPQDHLLLITIHHIAFDGWSQEILWQELAQCYEAFCQGENPDLPTMPWQYGDFARWERTRLENEGESQQHGYWQTRLAGAPLVATLPTDYPRPAVSSFRGGRETLRLPEQLVGSLKEIGRDAGVSLFMVLLAGFKALLNRYTSQTDLVVGTPYAHRKRRETMRLIGFCVNTLALRTDLSGNPTFRELLARVREVALGAYDHADIPFDRVVEQLHLERTAGLAPLVQVMFQLRRRPGPVALPELSLAEYRIDLGTAKSELAFELVETPNGLLCEAEFSTDLFERATARRLLESYQAVLESVVVDPNQRLADLKILLPPERRRLLALGVGAPHNNVASVVELFRDQVRKRPEAVAVICERQSLTYAELEQRSNQLARRLRSVGVETGSNVAVYDERSVDLVVAILGIFKAGGVYVPLEADLPNQRLRVLLDDVRPTVVLTRKKLVANLSATDANVCWESIPWDDCKPSIPAWDDSDLGTSLRPDRVAYILFTSGSSGKPKGVMVSHGSLAGHCDRIRHEYEVTDRDRVLQFAPASFDPSLEQMFVTLLSGATLCMRGNEIWDGQRLGSEVRDSCLTVVNIPPSVFRRWVPSAETSPGSTLFGQLRLVIVGGDVLPASAVAAWRRVAPPSVRLLNAYGPTEATITSTLFDVRDYDAKRHGSRIPIGRPAGNSSVYILDANLEPAPVGVPGDIYLGGGGVSCGYWNRPEPTAKYFIADPFAETPCARLYKTGDRGRWLPDGNVDFLGRSDAQLKVRDCRIEPGEIEAALHQHPSVRESLVVPRSDDRDQRLVAYVTFHRKQSADGRQLRRHLRQLLPSFMIPSEFVPLDALPMTRHGKIDYQALPEPAVHHADSTDERVAPRNAAEERLYQIWQRLLDTDAVGVTDSFFDLGGDSLQAVALMAEVNKEFGSDLPLATILQASTIEQMAALIEMPREHAASGPLVPLQTKGRQPPFFCVHTVGGVALRYRTLAQELGTDRPFYAIEAQGVDGRQLPQVTVEAMAARYVREVTALQPTGPYYLGGYCSGGIVAYEMARQLLASGREVDHVVFIDTCHPRLWEPPDLGLRIYRAIKRWVRVSVHHAYHAVGRRAPIRLTERLINEYLRRAFMHYRPPPYLGRVTMIRSTTHPYGEHRLLGWKSLLRKDTSVVTVPGDHLEILDNAQVLRHVAAALRETLAAPTMARAA